MRIFRPRCDPLHRHPSAGAGSRPLGTAGRKRTAHEASAQNATAGSGKKLAETFVYQMTKFGLGSEQLTVECGRSCAHEKLDSYDKIRPSLAHANGSPETLTVRTVDVDVSPPLLEMTGIVKEFPGIRALDGVDLEVRAGEVHCLLGQNGAGKSTLIKVLSGAHQPEAGAIRGRARRSPSRSPLGGLARGIATIYQELDLVDGLSVAENIFLGHEVSRGGFTRRGQLRAATPGLCSRDSATPRSRPAARSVGCPLPASRS